MPRSFWQRRAEQQAEARQRVRRAQQESSSQAQAERALRDLQAAATEPRFRVQPATFTESARTAFTRHQMDQIVRFYTEENVSFESTPGAVWSSGQTVTIPFTDAGKPARTLQAERLRRFKDQKPYRVQYHKDLDRWLDETHQWTLIKDMATKKLELYIDRIEKGWECAGQRHKLMSLKRELENRQKQ